MARSSLDIIVDLETVICHDEGDGIGDAEPYLWTAFFRIGGDDVTIVFDGIDFSGDKPKPIIHLEGEPFMRFGEGSHGNLNNSDVDEGDTVPIPSSVGEFRTLLRPIPIPQELLDLAEQVGEEVDEDIAGFVGVVAVLMEEDNVSDDGAEAGHKGLNAAIRRAIQRVIDTRSYDNSGVSQGEIDSLTDGISDAVSDAISDQQNIFEDIWAWLNADDEIGHQVFLFTTDDLAGQTPVELQKRWDNEGDWEIRGSLIPTVVCPADATAALLKALSADSGAVRYDRQSLQQFRDLEFLKHKGLAPWWDLVREHKGSISALLLRDQRARALGFELFQRVQDLAGDADQRVTDRDLDLALEFLALFKGNKNRRAGLAASRAASVFDRCRGKTVREAMTIFDAIPPTRSGQKAG